MFKILYHFIYYSLNYNIRCNLSIVHDRWVEYNLTTQNFLLTIVIVLQIFLSRVLSPHTTPHLLSTIRSGQDCQNAYWAQPMNYHSIFGAFCWRKRVFVRRRFWKCFDPFSVHSGGTISRALCKATPINSRKMNSITFFLLCLCFI